MQDYKALAFFPVGDAGDHERFFRGFGQLVKFFFDFDVRHHFAADFAETAEAVGDGEEVVFVFGGDVAGRIPAVLQNLRGFFRLAQITFHHVGAAHEQQAGSIHGQARARFRINDAHADSGQRMADVSAFAADLTKSGCAVIAGIDGDDRRTFSGSIAYQRANAKAIFECERQRLGKFFRAHDHELQASEIFWQAAARVLLEEGGRREEKSDAIIANHFANGNEVNGAWMKGYSDGEKRRKPQRDREAKGMEERK